MSAVCWSACNGCDIASWTQQTANNDRIIVIVIVGLCEGSLIDVNNNSLKTDIYAKCFNNLKENNHESRMIRIDESV
jgi:hypothetical protein